jgi:hypothetical protein
VTRLLFDRFDRADHGAVAIVDDGADSDRLLRLRQHLVEPLC